jgi:uncharacterized protein with ParB-like and HNH nuclease domain/predicted transport protein
MNAQDLPVTQLLDGAKQFIVPIFQRDYSWGTKHCLQLWNDILRVGQDYAAKGHFLGSVVYIAAEDNTAGITRWLLIDGQQRLTTLLLLLIALRKNICESEKSPLDADESPTPDEIDDYYLRNRHGRGERRYKLHLRRADQLTLAALIDGKQIPEIGSEKIKENFKFFTEMLAVTDPQVIYEGIKKLVIVDVSLTRGQDDPQAIFESLNSTGLDLTQADLIRNFVLMRLDEVLQSRLYEEYWAPIEAAFGTRYRTDFDKFVRDFLVLKTQPSSPLKSDEIYQAFRRFYFDAQRELPVDIILSDLSRFGSYYAAFALGQERLSILKEAFARLQKLVEVASPVILALYDCYQQHGSLSVAEFVEAVELVESYVFRRSVCDMETRNLGQIFSGIAYRIKVDRPLLTLKVALARQGQKRRFPADLEFQEALETRDLYSMRNCFYLLDRLENFSNEQIDTTKFTIKHILPQNEQLRPEWREMIGPNWKQVQQVLLHRLGNLTLSGYNSSYSDRPFDEKKALPGGFDESPLRLNKFIREQSAWTASQIEARGRLLAEKALTVWKPLKADPSAVRRAELEERIALSARYRIEQLPMDDITCHLFERLRPEILAIGPDIVELCNAKSMPYRVFDFFVEIIPRRYSLTLLLNLDFADCIDQNARIRDASEYAFIVNATEKGGVIYGVEHDEHLLPALAVIRQSFARVSE